MFRPKVMVIVISVMLLMVITYTILHFEKDPEDDTVTFYELFMDFDTSMMTFESYDPGDTVTVKDRIDRMEFRDNCSIVHDERDYDYLVDIWLDSVKQSGEYYKGPTLSIVCEQDRAMMESNFKVGDEITFLATVSNYKPDSLYPESTRSDVTTESCATGFKIVSISGLINDNGTKIEEMMIKVGTFAGNPGMSIIDTIIEMCWYNDVDITLSHYNRAEFQYEMLKMNSIKSFLKIHIMESLLDHIEKPPLSELDVFYYETIREMSDSSLTNGTLTPGDIVNIRFNLSRTIDPQLGGGLDPGSYVELKIIPKHGIPTLDEFRIPHVFPKKGEWIQL